MINSRPRQGISCGDNQSMIRRSNSNATLRQKELINAVAGGMSWDADLMKIEMLRKINTDLRNTSAMRFWITKKNPNAMP